MCISAISDKEDNFCDILFAFLFIYLLYERGL